MRLSSEQLPQHLRQGLSSLYVMFGDAPLLAFEAADRVRAAATAAGYAERTVLTAEQHFDWSRLKAETQAQSLFASLRMLELRIPGGKPGVEGAKALQALCAALPANTLVLIELPAMDWKAQKSAWFEALAAAGVMVEAAQIARNALPQWITGRLKAQQHSADAAALEFMADRVEGNLLAAYQEIQKLALLFPPGALSFEQIREAVLDVARFDIFEVGVLMLAGDVTRLARTLDGLKGEGAAAPLVLWAMTEEIRALGRVADALAAGRPLQQALREARIWGPRQKAIERHAPRVDVRRIEAALLHAARIDRMIKGLARGDVWHEFMKLGMRFAPGSHAATRMPPARAAVR